MEQKGLDEIEESFLGEEIIEDEVSSMTETKTKAAKKKTAKKVEDKETTTKPEEEVTITPVETKTPEPEVVKEIKKEEPKVESWGDESSGSTAWAILSGVLVILLLISVFTHGFSFGDNGAASGEAIGLNAAEELVLDYVNTNLLPEPFVAGLVGSEEAGDLYKVILSVNGQEIDSYITKDGTLFFPQGMEVTMIGDEVLEEVDRVEVSIDDDAIKGDENAPVTIVEFSDYECPYCAKFISETYPSIVENYINTGVVKLVFRDFPLSFHPEAEPAAIAAECAGEQGDYYGMHDILFANTANLGEDLYLDAAEELGLDMDAFTSCLEDPAIAEEIANDAADGAMYGVSGTPAFFINGELISGAQPYEAFEAAIERALAELEADSAADEETEVVEEVAVEAEEEEEVETVEETTEEVAEDTEAEEVVEEEEEIVEEVVEETTEVSGETVSYDLEAKKWRFTPSDISASVGDTVELTITPEDIGEFTFSIEAFDVEEVINGVTTLSFVASEAGTFDYTCSSCEEWRGMTGELVVE